DRLVARLRSENGGLGPSERAEVARTRLSAAIGRGLKPGNVGARRVGSAAAVMMDKSVLLSATAGEARSSHTHPVLLARQWALRLRAALSLPPLTLERAGVVVPIDESRSVVIGGVAAGPMSSEAGDARIASAAVDEAH